MPVAPARAVRAIKTAAAARLRRRAVAKHACKFSWALAGAFAGLAVCAADLLLEWRGAKFEAWGSAAGFWHNFDHVFATVVLAGFLGFVAGAIRDHIYETPQKAAPRKKKEVRPKANASQKTAGWRAVLPGRWPRFSDITFANVNFIARHWRGELPLWVSCWIVGVIGGLAISFVPAAALGVFTADKGYNPSSVLSVSAAAWIAVFAVAAWQAVGVWRATTRYAAAHDAAPGRTDDAEYALLWSGLARLAVIAGVAALAATFQTEWLPQLNEMFRIAFRNDPDIPPYSIRITKNGTEAEIVGGFKYGLADDFAAVAKNAPRLRVVNLDSAGGRLGEGEGLFTLIREHGLSTYVTSKCFSACTLAFAGGRERVLKRGAALGFHKGEFPGVSENEFDGLQYKVFSAAGFDSRFIERALATPHRDLWTPSPEVLLAAGVITGVADRAALTRRSLASK